MLLGSETRKPLIPEKNWNVQFVLKLCGEPADTDLNLVTVIAGTAWAAEVLAKAVLVRGSTHPFDLVDGTGADTSISGSAAGIASSVMVAGIAIPSATKISDASGRRTSTSASDRTTE